MAKNLGHVTIYFLQMSLYEVYAMQNDVVAEMKVREGALIKPTKISSITIIKIKKTINEV